MSLALPTGTPAVIDSGITGPGAGAPFVLQPGAPGMDISVNFQVLTATTISADLQVSHDGGTTFSILAAAILTAAPSAAGSTKTVTPMIAGPVYRLNYTTATGTIKVSACKN